MFGAIYEGQHSTLVKNPITKETRRQLTRDNDRQQDTNKQTVKANTLDQDCKKTIQSYTKINNKNIYMNTLIL